MHMQKEELMLFPFIRRMELSSKNGASLPNSPFGPVSNPIDPNKLTRTGTFMTDLLSENTLNYTKKINNHDFGALLGFTAQKVNNEANTIVATGFPDEEILSFNMASTLILDSPALPGTTSYYYTE